MEVEWAQCAEADQLSNVKN